MSMKKLKRKDRIISALIIASVFVVGFVVWYLPPAIAYCGSSEVYKRYSRVEGVRATYIKDFRVNDTLTVGVTLLEATDSAGWEYMVEAFNILPEAIEVAKEIPDADVWVWQILKNHPETKYVSDSIYNQKNIGIEIVSASMIKQQICIFHTRNEQEHNAIFHDRINANI